MKRKMNGKKIKKLPDSEFAAGLLLGALNLASCDMVGEVEGEYSLGLGKYTSGDYKGCGFVVIQPKEEVRQDMLDYAKNFFETFYEWVEMEAKEGKIAIIFRPWGKRAREN